MSLFVVLPKKGHFSVSRKVEVKTFFKVIVSYEEKLEKNNGANILDLSFTVFELFTNQVLVFSYISLLTQLPPFAEFSIFDRKLQENRKR